MNKEESIRKTRGKKTYQSPSLSVYGRVSQLTSSGSGTSLEGQAEDSSLTDTKEKAIKAVYRA